MASAIKLRFAIKNSLYCLGWKQKKVINATLKYEIRENWFINLLTNSSEAVSYLLDFNLINNIFQIHVPFSTLMRFGFLRKMTHHFYTS